MRSRKVLRKQTKPSQKVSANVLRVQEPSLRDVYVKACAENGIHANSGIIAILPDKPGMAYLGETLDFSNNYIGDRGIIPLLGVIEKLHNLKSILFVQNGLRNKGIDALCNGVANHPSLERIDVSGNCISEGAALSLERLLCTNKRIVDLAISHSKISVDWRVKLKDLVSLNRSSQLSHEIAEGEEGLRRLGVGLLNAVIPPSHQKVFTTLLRVNVEKDLNTTLRVAGGWVRDMLLGLYSNDIDIAIESPAGSLVSGEQFANEVSAFEAAESGKARTVGVIRVNPALSKHIETATVCVCGIPVEFCALRTDEYSADSRIPQVRPATPLMDALRRDFTMNALFYNLNTNMVEDYTTGLEDLQKRIIRCPLSPKETFYDDPLRLLRGVRFIGQLGKLNFSLHSGILECVDDELLDKLTQKVSRERVSKEFTKMMSSPLPEKCVEILFDMRLLQKYLLAEVYMKQVPGKKKFSSEIERIECLAEKEAHNRRSLESIVELNTLVSPLFSKPSSFLFIEEKERLMAMLFELIIPFFRSVPPLEVEKRLYAVCISGLKLPLQTFHCVQGMVNCYNVLLGHHFSIADLRQAAMQDSTKLIIFEALGHLSNVSVISKAFGVVLYTFLVLEEHSNLLHASKDEEEIMDLFIPLWRGLEAQQGLLNAYSLVLPVKGNDLKSIKGIEPTRIGALLMDIRKKVVLNPSFSREEIIDWLKEVVARENSINT